MIRRTVVAVAVAFLLAALPTVAGAQEAEMSGAGQPSRYLKTEQGWDTYRFHISGFSGALAGATSVGSVIDLTTQVVYEQGSGIAFGGRVGYTFASRFDAELEVGRSSPGLNTATSNLNGSGRVEAEFADLSVTHFMGVVHYSIVERSRRLVPYLGLGMGLVHVSSNDEPAVNATKAGLTYGLGLRLRLAEQFLFRTDIRGLRAGFGSGAGVEDGVPAVLRGEIRATYLLWTAGAEFRF